VLAISKRRVWKEHNSTEYNGLFVLVRQISVEAGLHGCFLPLMNAGRFRECDGRRWAVSRLCRRGKWMEVKLELIGTGGDSKTVGTEVDLQSDPLCNQLVHTSIFSHSSVPFDILRGNHSVQPVLRNPYLILIRVLFYF